MTSNTNSSSKRKNKNDSIDFSESSFFIEKIKGDLNFLTLIVDNYFLTKSTLEGLVKTQQISNGLLIGGE